MKRALVVGIDDYINFDALAGCVNDANAIEPLLARNEDGSPNFVPHKRTSIKRQTTRDAILGDVADLLAPGADVAVLYWAGHGAGEPNEVTLVTTDGTKASPGIKLSEVLTRVHESSVREVILILDCCFAGAGGGVPQMGFGGSALRDGVTLLAASRGDQTAAETESGRGVFSTYLEGALVGGAADVAGKVTVAGVYAYLDESFGAWDQRPVFKANLDRLHELRRCQPAVPVEDLRALSTHFPEPGFSFPLDRSYEPDEQPADPEHEAIFAVLQKYRAAKLLVPVNEDHMYYAAIHSGSCVLTPLGQHYWRLANESRL